MRTESLILLCSLMLLGCRADRPQRTIALHATPVQMREEVLKQIPIGTSLERAHAILAESGFQRLRESLDEEEWDDTGRFAAPKPTLARVNADPSCITYRRDGPAGFLVTGTWQVALYHDSGAVKDVQVSTSFTGP